MSPNAPAAPVVGSDASDKANDGSNITAPIADDTISAAMPAPKWTPILENSQRATYDLQMHGRDDNLIA